MTLAARIGDWMADKIYAFRVRLHLRYPHILPYPERGWRNRDAA